jgi:hypothetical protein
MKKGFSWDDIQPAFPGIQDYTTAFRRTTQRCLMLGYIKPGKSQKLTIRQISKLKENHKKNDN